MTSNSTQILNHWDADGAVKSSIRWKKDWKEETVNPLAGGLLGKARISILFRETYKVCKADHKCNTYTPVFLDEDNCWLMWRFHYFSELKKCVFPQEMEREYY